MASSSLTTDGEAGRSLGIESDKVPKPPVALVKKCERCKSATVKRQVPNVENKTN